MDEGNDPNRMDPDEDYVKKKEDQMKKKRDNMKLSARHQQVIFKENLLQREPIYSRTLACL